MKSKGRTPDELWLYHPAKKEMVLKIALYDFDGEAHNMKCAPSNGLSCVIWTRRGTVIGASYWGVARQ